MTRLKLSSLLSVVVSVFAGLFSLSSVALAQSIDLARADERRVVDLIVSDISKHFYDPNLNGVNLKALGEETKQKISTMNDVGQMNAAIWELVLKVGDSHTRFTPPRLTLTPTFGLKARGVGDDVMVVQLTPNSPAVKAGVQLGDKILALNGVQVTRNNVRDVLFFFRYLRPVRLLVMDYERNGERGRATIEPTFRREPLHGSNDLTSFYRDVVEAENEAHENPFEYGNVGDFGYVKLASFDGPLPETVMWKIKDRQAVIVDLRGNPGGDTDIIRQLAGFFDHDQTPIADMIMRKKTEKLTTKPQRVQFTGPMVVLVDSASASASEIFAYHVQRTGRGVVIGDKTAGKVSAAQVFFESVNNGTLDFGLMTTVGKVIFPDGKNIEKIGVTPDVVCTPTQQELAGGKDPCLSRAAAILKAKMGGETTQSAAK